MTDIGFAPKEVIPPQVCRLEILDADKADTYGPQIYLKLKVVGGEHDGHTFNDYANRDEDTGQIKQGSKAWTIFEACLGQGLPQTAGRIPGEPGRQAVRRPGHADKDRVQKQGRVRHRGSRAAGRATTGPPTPATTTATASISRTFRFEGGGKRGGLRVLPAPRGPDRSGSGQRRRARP